MLANDAVGASVAKYAKNRGTMLGDLGTIENRERDTWKPTHAFLVGSETGGSVGLIIV